MASDVDWKRINDNVQQLFVCLSFRRRIETQVDEKTIRRPTAVRIYELTARPRPAARELFRLARPATLDRPYCACAKIRGKIWLYHWHLFTFVWIIFFSLPTYTSITTAYHHLDGFPDFFTRPTRTTGLVWAAGRTWSIRFAFSSSLFVEFDHVLPRSEFPRDFHSVRTPCPIQSTTCRYVCFSRGDDVFKVLLGWGGRTKKIHNTMSNTIIAGWHENQKVHQGKPDEKYQHQCCIR